MIFQAWARLCKCLGQDFLPYMSVVMPPLLQSAQLKPDVIITSADSDADVDDSDDDRFVYCCHFTCIFKDVNIYRESLLILPFEYWQKSTAWKCLLTRSPFFACICSYFDHSCRYALMCSLASVSVIIYWWSFTAWSVIVNCYMFIGINFILW